MEALVEAVVRSSKAALGARRLARLTGGVGKTVLARLRIVVTPFAWAVLVATLSSVSLLLIAIWGLTRPGYFWPGWALLAFGFLLAAQGWLAFVGRGRWPLPRPLAAQLGVSAALWLALVGVWTMTTRAYFWPVWVLLGLVVAAGLHLAGLVLVPRVQHPLAERVRVLTATRTAAIEQQEARLRQIERDLHDGAQARLVALGMTLALAEQRFRDDPDAARELVGEARWDARAALQELRDLARGINPPLLTDRGLGPAIEALAVATPIPVDLHYDLPRRPSPATEAAAYFVVAEALTNVAKHAGATRATINIALNDDCLHTEIHDDGHGGANPAGSGLIGLRQRVEALDGTLVISSPPGGSTTVEAAIPCAS
jgi:signal transduction histidine kinase